MSEDVFNALFKLKKFNYENIYKYSLTDEEKSYYRDGMNKIYNRYLNDIDSGNTESIIFKFLNDKSTYYMNNTDNKRKVIDFIAGMTDDLFLKEIAR